MNTVFYKVTEDLLTLILDPRDENHNTLYNQLCSLCNEWTSTTLYGLNKHTFKFSTPVNAIKGLALVAVYSNLVELTTEDA